MSYLFVIRSTKSCQSNPLHRLWQFRHHFPLRRRGIQVKHVATEISVACQHKSENVVGYLAKFETAMRSISKPTLGRLVPPQVRMESPLFINVAPPSHTSIGKSADMDFTFCYMNTKHLHGLITGHWDPLPSVIAVHFVRHCNNLLYCSILSKHMYFHQLTFQQYCIGWIFVPPASNKAERPASCHDRGEFVSMHVGIGFISK